MDYEKKYKEALNLAKSYYEKEDGGANQFLDTIFPELRESEDEETRQFLINWINQNGIGTLHYIDISWKERCIAYLEKQKEKKPAEPSDEELQRHQDELYDFKVFAARQAKEHHISFVHDFEWNNFCAELLSYFNEKQKPAEWSKEDERKIQKLVALLKSSKERCMAAFYKDIDECIAWICDLHSSWKPSEEQPVEGLSWHSVEESLPEIDEEVIVLADRLNLGSLFAIAFGHIVDKEKAVDYDGWNIPGVKFWMPMPKMPEEKK